MVADSVEFLAGRRARGALRRRALLRRLPAQPRVQRCGCSRARCTTGATALVLCDTNGGSAARTRSSAIVREVVDVLRRRRRRSAVHLHDDAGTGVANALAGVRGGAMQVQGTINGYGERTGNCNLTTIIPNLTLKMGIETIPADRLERLTPVAHHVAELVNMALNPQAAYVGSLGVRAQGRAARERDRQAPRRVRARLARLGRQRHPLRGVGARGQVARSCSRRRSSASSSTARSSTTSSTRSSGMEHEGYHFEVADASLELLMRRADRLGAAAGSRSSRSG